MITVLLPLDVLVAINAKFVKVPTNRSTMAHPTTTSSYVVQESILRASVNEKGTPTDLSDLSGFLVKGEVFNWCACTTNLGLDPIEVNDVRSLVLTGIGVYRTAFRWVLAPNQVTFSANPFSDVGVVVHISWLFDAADRLTCSFERCSYLKGSFLPCY